ncbi:MAG TPA: M28 family peptidase [Planctomycetota bacterium]|jgi:hypothetical protein|nr:M28 family peptidase [Planctomycetota bacterium]
MLRRRTPFLFLAFLAAAPLAAQEVPFFTPSEWSWLSSEVSGDRAYEHDRWFTHYHRPFASEGLRAVARYAEEKAKEAGLEGVRLLVQSNDPDEGMEWTPRRGELWTLEPEVARLCDMGSVQTSLADRSRPCDATAGLVEVGPDAKDFEGKELAGKVILTSAPFGTAFAEGVWKRGALGVVWYPGPEAFLDYPDQVRWLSIPAKSEEGKPGTFGFVLSRRQGVELSRRLRGGPVTVRAVVEAEIQEPGWLVLVEGRIPGTEPALPEVVFTAHLQEERFSANDDGSGCANTLEVARALRRCIAEGRLPRPRRTMRFWWTTEIASENRFFSEHPEEVERVFCDVNQDMVGASQADSTMRVQNVTRLPWARAHVLEDVVEEIVGALVEGNTVYLNAGQRGLNASYTRPVLARLGSRHRYNARLIPFHNSTDHQSFTAPPVGKPAFTFTNWPDDFIHSSDDDLRNIDPTQLQRNALAAAAVGYTMARLSARDATRLAGIAFGNAARRFGREVRVAMGLLTDPGDLPLGERAKRARAQLRIAYEKEARAIASIADATGCPEEDLGSFLVELDHLHEHAGDLLERTSIGLNGGAPPDEEGSEAEDALAKTRPRLAGTVADYYARRGKVHGDFHGLGGLMQWEVLSFANGSRSGLEIYEGTAAEARSAGSWYYGEVRPEGVLAFLKACAEAKVVELGGGD